MADYTPNNNPYIPGDPYSYDLKWMVNDIKHMENRFAELDEQVEYATDKALMSEGFANGEQNGEAVDPDSPYYHDNAKYWKDEAASEADRSRDEADRSDAEALVSEGYARGTQDGQAVPSGSPYYHNNSKYYSEESANSAQEAADYAAHIADPVSGIVTDWLNNNITQPTTPAVDTSLTVAGAAADAKVVGDFRTDFFSFDIKEAAKNPGQLNPDGTYSPSTSTFFSDILPIPPSAYLFKMGNELVVSNVTYHLPTGVIFFDESQNIISYVSSDAPYLEAAIPEGAKYIQFSQANPANPSVDSAIVGAWYGYNNDQNYVDVAAGDLSFIHFTTGKAADTDGSIITSAAVKVSDLLRIPPNVSAMTVGNMAKLVPYTPLYHLPVAAVFYDENQAFISYSSSTSDYARVIIPSGAVYMRINQYYLDNPIIDYGINYIRFELPAASEAVYVVDQNGTGDFTSVTDCFLALKNDKSPKRIEILGGDYDIYAEYVAAGVPVNTQDDPTMDFMPYCVFVPENSHVIGKGDVRLLWMPDPTDGITWKQCQAVSPINVLGSMTLENVEIHCKNGRYCIHDDILNLAAYAGAHYIFKDVKCYKYNDDIDSTTTPGSPEPYGKIYTIGYGLNKYMRQEYINCYFWNEGNGAAFYGHTNLLNNGQTITEDQSAAVNVENCIIISGAANAAQLDNSQARNQRVKFNFRNCYLNKKVNVGGLGSYNAYELTFLNCGTVDIHINAGNIYTPAAYNTTLNNV